jgi:hypothetical protein
MMRMRQIANEEDLVATKLGSAEMRISGQISGDSYCNMELNQASYESLCSNRNKQDRRSDFASFPPNLSVMDFLHSI